MPDTLDPLDPQRLQMMQVLIADFNATADRVQKSYSENIAQMHRILLLASGVLGLVLPLVADKGGAGSYWLLRRSAVCFGVSVAWGVLVQCVTRYLMVGVTFRHQRTFHETAALYGRVFDEEDFGGPELNAELQKITNREEARAKRLIWTLSVPSDIVFYGSFLGGIYYLVQALRYL